MATEAHLPTADDILGRAEDCLDEAYRALGDAADWLRSDWRPLGSSMTVGQAARRDLLREAIGKAKQAINEGKS